MVRRVSGIVLAAFVVAGLVVDLAACGDKFLRPGRSARQAKYAAAYPSAILLVKSPRAKDSVVKEWQKMLKAAGHKSRIASSPEEVAAAVASQPYDLVIADYGYLLRLKPAIESAATTPHVLPVMSQSSQQTLAAVRGEFYSVIDPATMSPVEALQEIDRLMEHRLRTAVRTETH